MLPKDFTPDVIEDPTKPGPVELPPAEEPTPPESPFPPHPEPNPGDTPEQEPPAPEPKVYL